MIKLIAADMDGTLLDDAKNLPPDFEEVTSELAKRNIIFALSSGRSRCVLQPLFEKYKYHEKFVYICDNGGNVVLPEHEPVTDVIPPETVQDILDTCDAVGNIVPVLCCVGDIYYPKTAYGMFSKEITNFYTQHVQVDDMHAVTDPCIKVAVCDMQDPLKNSYPIFRKKYGDTLSCVVSGTYWMDVQNKGTDKGTAIHRLQQLYNIKPEETMVFGDNFNDAPMMKQAYYSYVMDNASDEMKKNGRFIAPNNNENGVTKVIRKRLNI